MPYSRYGGGPPSARRDEYRGGGGPRQYDQGYLSGHGAMVSPWQGGPPGALLPTPGPGGSGELALALGSLLNPGGAGGGGGGASALASLAGQLAVAQASMGGGLNPFAGGGPVGPQSFRRDREDIRPFRRERPSPHRGDRNRGYGRRSRTRSPVRRGRHDDRGRKRHRESSPQKDRPEHEIYIGNYPVKFRETELRQLFQDHGVQVKAIRMKHDGLKVFAFAETENKAEIEKAIEAMDSKEINGRRLRVRSAGDKEPRPTDISKSTVVKRELTVADVTRHLAFAFNAFLDRQMVKDGVDQEKVESMKQAQILIRSAFDLPNDDSLMISRDLELIFMQNNRREIKIPESQMETNLNTQEDDDKAGTEGEMKEEAAAVDHCDGADDGNWKRRKLTSSSGDENEDDLVEPERQHRDLPELDGAGDKALDEEDCDPATMQSSHCEEKQPSATKHDQDDESCEILYEEKNAQTEPEGHSDEGLGDKPNAVILNEEKGDVMEGGEGGFLPATGSQEEKEAKDGKDGHGDVASEDVEHAEGAPHILVDYDRDLPEGPVLQLARKPVSRGSIRSRGVRGVGRSRRSRGRRL